MHVVNYSKFRIRFANNGGTAYFPKKLLTDSAFPFKRDDELIIKIDGERLVIMRQNSDIGLKEVT